MGKVAVAFSLVDQFLVFIISNGNDNIALLQNMLADYNLEALASWEPPKSFNKHSMGDEVCISQQCFANRINACESGQFLAQLGRGRKRASGLRGIYTVEESTNDGQCLLSFKFTTNPNPDYIDKKIFYSVERNADVAENFKKMVLTPLMNCLEGNKEASKNCSGPLLDAMGAK